VDRAAPPRPGPGAQLTSAVAGLPVERLRPADVDDCVALAADRDWAPEPDKWRLLFQAGEVYGVRDPAGGLAGTVTVTIYAPGLAAVGMMLVAARYNRQGLGRALMTSALDRIGGAVTVLFATAPGRPLYERLGFRPADVSVRHIGHFVARPALPPQPALPARPDLPPRPDLTAGFGAPEPPPRPATEADLPGIAALDRRAFGADRSAVLGLLPRLAERFLVLSGPAGRSDPAGRVIRGFGAARPHNGTLLIGPVVAASEDAAAALIAALAAGDPRPARIEIPGRHPGLARWAAASGLEPRSQTTFMAHGGAVPGHPGQVFAPFDVAMG
jgi:GNAT superfamily N-acetyltransferase